MHVVDSHRSSTDPEPVYDGVLEFLGLPEAGYPVFEQHNARPRSPMAAGARGSAWTSTSRPYDERLAAWLGHPVSWRAEVEPAGTAADVSPDRIPGTGTR